MRPLLDVESGVMEATQADTAVFYSISNCLVGLRGISFGNFLIKQVVAELLKEGLPLKTFVTLSPIPGFSRWLKKLDEETLAKVLPTEMTFDRNWLEGEDWQDDRERVREPLRRLCAHDAGFPESKWCCPTAPAPSHRRRADGGTAR